jgi:gamma-glutamylcyclotransferase (GGCT)/AIG2-like uncharacterized protein YtfP
MKKIIKYHNLLFVYGLLRKASGHEMSRHLRKHADYLGSGYLHGTLYLIDHYPGAMVNNASQNQIIGDLFGFDDDLLWAVLDRFEEVDITDEYLRMLVDVHFNEMQVKCWTYIYNRPLTSLIEISKGDFIEYIHSNKSK